MLTYLANEGFATVPELAEKFGIDAKTVVSELELAACFGLPPYTPDQLLEILVIGDEVHVNSLEALERPLRLTSDEGFALAASARTLMHTTGVDAESPLAGALKKLEAVLGNNRVAVEVEIPASLELLQSAASTQTIVNISYPVIDETQPAYRRVEPYAVVFREGKFYLDAFCHYRNDWRRFLVANIADVTVTDEQGEVRTPPAEFLGNRAFVASSSTPRATIVMPAESQYFIEPLTSLPIEPLGDTRILVTLAVGNERWLGGLLLRLGSDAQVIAPPSLQGAKAAAAAAALARYS
jgi:proteasome accessory factor C